MAYKVFRTLAQKDNQAHGTESLLREVAGDKFAQTKERELKRRCEVVVREERDSVKFREKDGMNLHSEES